MKGIIEKKPHIFALDDELDILELIQVNLRRSGFEVETFTSASSLFNQLQTKIPDLLILDIMLPDMDGLDICKKMRADSRFAGIPILFLTAKGEEVDVVLGLELGGDDYMIKPFSPKELIARIKAILRRRNTPQKEAEAVLKFAELEIDLNRHEASINGKTAPLTATEFSILWILAQKPGWVFSREMILDRLWGAEKDVLDRTVDVHIKNMREKLGSAGRMVRNVRGVGYKLES